MACTPRWPLSVGVVPKATHWRRYERLQGRGRCAGSHLSRIGERGRKAEYRCRAFQASLTPMSTTVTGRPSRCVTRAARSTVATDEPRSTSRTQSGASADDVRTRLSPVLSLKSKIKSVHIAQSALGLVFGLARLSGNTARDGGDPCHIISEPQVT